MRVCVITDNKYIYEQFRGIVKKSLTEHEFTYFYSTRNKNFSEIYAGDDIRPIRLKECNESFFNAYDVFFSLHCKQIFPEVLVRNYRCINVHPGLNPYNRGWFPQVFSIINGLPAGVTIHEMDTELDHGPIIFQREIKINSYDTSKDVYSRILKTEMELLEEHFVELIEGRYSASKMLTEGNINYMDDFKALCKLNMEHEGTMREHLNLLRAVSFAGYKNACYEENGERVYVTVSFEHGENRGGKGKVLVIGLHMEMPVFMRRCIA